MTQQSFTRRVPDGDDRERRVCDTCSFVDYENPKLVVGSVVTHGDKFLMCKRAIEPRVGYWTLPAGFLELHETPEQGAMREAQEEALATIEIDALLAIYSIPHISQVQMFFRAKLAEPSFAPGPESTEVALYTWDEIPWSELAFPTSNWALEVYRETQGQTHFAPRTNPGGAGTRLRK